MLNRVQRVVQKFDHILLLGALVSMVASPIWEEFERGDLLWSEISIIMILVSGLSITYTNNSSGNYFFQYVGIAVIITTLMNNWLNLGMRFSYFASYFQVGYFLFLAFTTVKIILKSETVNSEVVVNTISGYLLMGLGWSIIVSMWILNFPESFSFTQEIGNNSFNAFYYAFVTMTTLGYGDLLPLTAAAQSLSILISVSGAFYTTIVLGMIVGKYISTESQKK